MPPANHSPAQVQAERLVGQPAGPQWAASRRGGAGLLWPGFPRFSRSSVVSFSMCNLIFLWLGVVVTQERGYFKEQIVDGDWRC